MPLEVGKLDRDVEAYLTGKATDTIYTGEMILIVQLVRMVRSLSEKVDALTREVHNQRTDRTSASSDVDEIIDILNDPKQE